MSGRKSQSNTTPRVSRSRGMDLRDNTPPQVITTRSIFNKSSFMSPNGYRTRSSPRSSHGAPSKPRGAGAGVSVSAMGNTPGHLIFSTPKKGNQSYESRSNILEANQILIMRDMLSAKTGKNAKKIDQKSDRMMGVDNGSVKRSGKVAVKMAKKARRKHERKHGRGN